VDLANSGEVIFFCLGVAEINKGFRHTKFVHVIGKAYSPQNKASKRSSDNRKLADFVTIVRRSN
jgi:hypothetical protein